MIIGLSGKKQSGKSVLANYLTDRRFEVRSFAGPLKVLISEAFGIPMLWLTDNEFKEKMDLNLTIQPLHIKRLVMLANEKYYPVTDAQLSNALANIPKDIIKSPRQLLQVVGTDIFRNTIDVNYWLNAFKYKLDPNKNYVCDDARFANEQQLIKNLNGYVIGINRPGLKSDTHASEQIDLTQCDFVIQNNKTLDDLKAEIDVVYKLIEELKWHEVKNETNKRPLEDLSVSLKQKIVT